MITLSAVILNGEIVWDHGSATGRLPGRVLARSGPSDRKLTDNNAELRGAGLSMRP